MVKTSQKPRKMLVQKQAKLHLGICVNGVEIEDRLAKLKIGSEIVVHRFENPHELYEQNQRSYIDMVILASGPEKHWIAEMLRWIKSDTTLLYIPILIYAPGAPKSLIISSLKEGADDFTAEEWDGEIIGAKMEMLIARSQRDLSLNPSTRLPGPNAIEYEIDHRLHQGEGFAVCYADIDNFKAYNDYYGYVYGDKIIKITSHIIRNVVHDLAPDGFVGHIGGDDYIFIIPTGKVKPVCENIIATFDRMVPFRYNESDLERGWIEIANRKGEPERFSIITLSIAVIINQKKMFKHPGEMSHMLADLKKYTKALPGSNYMVERRRKY